jgi:hypothetical protein
LETLLPEPSQSVSNAISNAKKRRKRVQGKAGEVLTEEESLWRLEEESIPKGKVNKKRLPKID